MGPVAFDRPSLDDGYRNNRVWVFRWRQMHGSCVEPYWQLCSFSARFALISYPDKHQECERDPRIFSSALSAASGFPSSFMRAHLCCRPP